MDAFFETFDPVVEHKRSFDAFVRSIVRLVNASRFEGNDVQVCLSNARVSMPLLEEFGIRRYAYPSECRHRNLTYAANLTCEVHIDEKRYDNIVLGKIPILVGSTLCTTQLTECKHECAFDPGGYFIVNGSEKSVVAQERMVSNYVYVFETSEGLKTVEYRAQREGELKVHRLVLYQKRGRIFGRTQVQENIPIIEFCTTCLGIEKELAIEWIGGRYEFSTDVRGIDPDLILPNMPHDAKFATLCAMVRILYAFENGLVHETDRDHTMNKRIDWSGDLMFGLFKQIWSRFTRDAQTVLQKTDVYAVTPSTLFRSTTITNGLRYSLSTGNWGISNKFRSGVSQVLNRMNHAASLSQLRRINSPVGKEGKIVKPRMLHASCFGRVCPSETPEGANTGLIKALANGATVSSWTPTHAVRLCLLDYEDLNATIRYEDTLVMMNGTPIGTVAYPNRLVDWFRSLRRRCDVALDVSIVYDAELELVSIQTDAGRLLRPLWIRRDDDPDPSWSWDRLVQEGYVEYLDAYEETNAVVAPTKEQMRGDEEYTHAEIHSNFVFGMGTAEIPFANHSQAPRIVYQAAQKKQAIGVPHTNPSDRLDSNTHVLWYAQKPIVTTEFQESYVHRDLTYAGHNAVVAIMCYTGFNQEDSVIVNRSAVDRGLFRSYLFKTVTEECTGDDRFERPGDRCVARKFADYTKLDSDGVPPLDALVRKQDVLVGRTAKKASKTHDTSVLSKFETSRVNRVMRTTAGTTNSMIKIETREMRVPEIGDKVSNRAAQKGTIGLLLSQEDMPFCPKTGMVPDIIMNPHAIPSRMTISQILETIIGKGGILDGRYCDGTPFSNPGDALVREAKERLRVHGYDPLGTERLINGMTGESMEANVFMGPVYYQRLKHMVADKYHARARGPIQGITRQPTEGRARSGSIRAGEMERDAFIAHGVSAVLNDRFMDCSDRYETNVCTVCGMFSSQVCRHCGKEGEVRNVSLPYATKLLFQELMSMGITCAIKLQPETIQA